MAIDWLIDPLGGILKGALLPIFPRWLLLPPLVLGTSYGAGKDIGGLEFCSRIVVGCNFDAESAPEVVVVCCTSFRGLCYFNRRHCSCLDV
ncbi:hypothetical protein Nepgr_009391 [Nepenthes gracilis]|uniref:Uncharacterized protein n=1 Tax=Nepenthes gracilis TaxID=150966 RepID=A0AAD3SB79_NEPGR|nr:hypothetical protein Nepgr_009391 [Nepenthes gracilis]